MPVEPTIEQLLAGILAGFAGRFRFSLVAAGLLRNLSDPVKANRSIHRTSSRLATRPGKGRRPLPLDLRRP